MTSYSKVLVTYGVGVAALAMRVGRGDRAFGSPTSWADIGRIGIAAHKLSRLVTRAKVATPIREPFTTYDRPGDPGEVLERPTGSGLRRAVGELLSCPFCLDMWVATGLVASREITPRWHHAAVTLLDAVAVADVAHYATAVLAHVSEGHAPGSTQR